MCCVSVLLCCCRIISSCLVATKVATTMGGRCVYYCNVNYCVILGYEEVIWMWKGNI